VVSKLEILLGRWEFSCLNARGKFRGLVIG
jgi:hypothetical protein